ncbi:MAG: hypothetical protein NTZ34_05380 [Chloroflexi bacterium]|nr:hypothetical protein [Chloroflexota bacterium]
MLKGQSYYYRQLLAAFLVAGLVVVTLVFTISFCFGEAADIPHPPDVNIQIIPVNSSLERGESTPLNIIISNKSGIALRNVKLLVIPGDLVEKYVPEIADILPFGTAHTVLTLTPGNTAAFAANNLVVEVQYTWTDGSKEFRTSTTGSISITVKRKFAEELGGLLPGGAAVLYFLIPILPAVAAYQFIDEKRRGVPITFTSFNATSLVPGVAGSALANVITYQIIGNADILNIVTFFEVFGVSMLVGACIPSIRWGWSIFRWWKWGFHTQDSKESLLEKALTGKCADESGFYYGVLLTAGVRDLSKPVDPNSHADSWEGLLLNPGIDTYPGKNTHILGPLLNVRILDEADRPYITSAVIDVSGAVFDRKKIIRAVNDKKLEVEVPFAVTHNNEPVLGLVYIVDGVYTQEVREKGRIVSLI